MMKQSSRLALPGLCLCLALASVPLLADDSTISEDEREQLLRLLDESEAMFLGLLAGVSDAQWAFKPGEDRWSVGECAEHILRSNEALLDFARQAMEAPPNPEWQEKTKGKAELLLQVMPNRRPGGAGGATSPQEIRPTGEISRAEIVERFQALYDDLAKTVRESQEPWKEHTAEHPFPIFNTLSAYDWILYVPLHTIRHSKQMVEVMETEGYPVN